MTCWFVHGPRDRIINTNEGNEKLIGEDRILQKRLVEMIEKRGLNNHSERPSRCAHLEGQQVRAPVILGDSCHIWQFCKVSIELPDLGSSMDTFLCG